MLKHIHFFAFFLLMSFSVAAQKITISGYVKDAKNSEGVIGASVYLKEISNGTTTNNYGFYSITIPKGTYNLVFSSLGYQKELKLIENVQNNITLNIELKDQRLEIEEVIISGKRKDDNVKKTEMSVNKLDIKTLKKIPALLGEVDLIRAIQLLPGVSTVGEGASGFNVRGGGVDQNLVLLDDAPVYNSSHLFGFFSIFNPDAVKDVKLIKGGIPSNYGGRASSILDVRMKEGNAKKLEVNGGIGFIFSRLSVEAPIVKNKASFIVAGRRSYIDVLAKPFLTGDTKNAIFNFYDLTAKVNYNINQKNTVFLSGYFGRDVFGTQFGFDWGNATLTGRWNHVFSSKLFMNATTFYSNYDYKLDSDLNNERPNNSFKWTSNIQNLSFKPDFTYYINPKNTISFGGQILSYAFRPGSATASSNGVKINFGSPSKDGVEYAAHVGNEWKVSPKLSVQYGLRYSKYDYSTQDKYYFKRRKLIIPNLEKFPSGYTLDSVLNNPGKTLTSYNNFEPRLNVKIETGDNSSVKVSYNRMSQYIHLMSNTAASTPLDVWTSSTNNIKPQLSDQVALGYFQNLKDNMYETSAEVYYKTLENQIDYADRANLFLNPAFEKDLLFGDGRAYGAEFFVKKNKGKLTGWISYTLAKTERKVEGLNNNNWYPNRYDRTHTLNLVGQYELNKKWSFGANFTYISGVPYSIAEQQYRYEGFNVSVTAQGVRGNLRIPAYHRLDLSATKKNKKALFGKGESEWVFSIYNLYNKRNPFSIYTKPNEEDQKQLAKLTALERESKSVQNEAVRLSIIGTIVPSVSYNFKF